MISPKSRRMNYQNDEGYFDNIEKYYALEKGTYYLQIDTNNEIFEIESTISKVAYQAGNSKVDAKTLKVDDNSAIGYFTLSNNSSEIAWIKLL